MREAWHVEVGNYAVLVETIRVIGELSTAVRAARKAIKGTTYLAQIRRPGCAVIRTVTE